MERAETRAELADPDKSGPRPGKFLVELQQREFDKLGVDRTVGCRAAGAIDGSKDAEMAALQTTFMRTAQRAYLKALDDRSKKRASSSKKKGLESRRKMTRARPEQ